MKLALCRAAPLPATLVLAALLTLPCNQRSFGSSFTFTFARALPAPATNTFALGFGDDGYLWVHTQALLTFYKLDPMDGAVLQSFPSNGPLFMADLDVKNGILYAGEEPTIYRYDTATGTQLPPLTGPIISGSIGLTFVGDDMYVSGGIQLDDGLRICRVSPETGELLSSSDRLDDMTDSQGLGGLDGYACYVTLDGSGLDRALRIIDPSSGVIVESHTLFSAPYALFSPDAANGELFISRRDLEQIWVYSYSSEPTATNATSWGQIKALYR